MYLKNLFKTLSNISFIIAFVCCIYWNYQSYMNGWSNFKSPTFIYGVVSLILFFIFKILMYIFKPNIKKKIKRKQHREN